MGKHYQELRFYQDLNRIVSKRKAGRSQTGWGMIIRNCSKETGISWEGVKSKALIKLDWKISVPTVLALVLQRVISSSGLSYLLFFDMLYQYLFLGGREGRGSSMTPSWWCV